MTYEEEIISRHSTPGLKKAALDRSAKKDHLAGFRSSPEETKLLLDEMYGPEPEEQENVDD